MDRNYNPFSDEQPKKAVTNFNYKKPDLQPTWESLYVGLEEIDRNLSEVTFENEAVSSSLFDDVETEHEPKRTYQIHKKYIVSSIKSGIVIINQKRAHERVLYEEFLSNMTVHHASSQQLLFPLELYYSVNDVKLIREIRSSLENLGFIFDHFSKDSIMVSGLPVTITESQIPIIFDDLLTDFQNGVSGDSFSQNDSIAQSMAKCLAVKTGTYLTEREQENLVNNLFACREPNVSPFQKPTFITMSVEDLDKKFSL